MLVELGSKFKIEPYANFRNVDLVVEAQIVKVELVNDKALYTLRFENNGTIYNWEYNLEQIPFASVNQRFAAEVEKVKLPSHNIMLGDNKIYVRYGDYGDIKEEVYYLINYQTDDDGILRTIYLNPI